MTLDEEIKHCEEVAEENEKRLKSWGRLCSAKIEEQTCLECAKEHRQLAEWLEELETYQEGINEIKNRINIFKRCDMLWDKADGMELALELLGVEDDD